ncbi:hypothetical protein EDB85DRAFT_1896542 [Lactarius pseudohatsudake]|nr:hypothetical protein EDB85DRAFT_1896542 [Lactarius pseudohatsudake]
MARWLLGTRPWPHLERCCPRPCPLESPPCAAVSPGRIVGAWERRQSGFVTTPLSWKDIMTVFGGVLARKGKLGDATAHSISLSEASYLASIFLGSSQHARGERTKALGWPRQRDHDDRGDGDEATMMTSATAIRQSGDNHQHNNGDKATMTVVLISDLRALSGSKWTYQIWTPVD